MEGTVRNLHNLKTSLILLMMSSLHIFSERHWQSFLLHNTSKYCLQFWTFILLFMHQSVWILRESPQGCIWGDTDPGKHCLSNRIPSTTYFTAKIPLPPHPKADISTILMSDLCQKKLHLSQRDTCLIIPLLSKSRFSLIPSPNL